MFGAPQGENMLKQHLSQLYYGAILAIVIFECDPEFQPIERRPSFRTLKGHGHGDGSLA